MTEASKWHLLPPDMLELQIGQMDLLMAMYPQELILDQSTHELLDTLREGLCDTRSVPLTISPLLRLPISTPQNERSESIELVLELTVSFVYKGDEIPQEPPDARVRIQASSWLSRAATNQLMGNVPEREDLLGTIENIKDAAAHRYEQTKIDARTWNAQDPVTMPGPLVRVWFYFPSISTRSKRDDFIIHAPSYSLTGFLYAGKPGLLCVEGVSQNIDDYMKYIKTESWGDIPAHHKKVSERYRESISNERVFEDMTEITNKVGERRGQRANRGDMKAVEEWLGERGLGEAFAKVLM